MNALLDQSTDEGLDFDLEGIDEYALIADVCRSSLWEFVKEFWGEIVNEPLVENWHMPVICRKLEAIAERVINRLPKTEDLLINISPGTSKSTLVSVMFPAWLWTKANWLQIITGSYDEKLALDLSDKTRDLVKSEKYQACFPEVTLKKGQDAKYYYKLTTGAWRFCTSTGGSVTGRHGHIIIIDDPVDPNGAISRAELEAACRWLTDTIPNRVVSQERTPLIMIMQRLAEDDPSGMWLKWAEKGTIKLDHLCLPAELTDRVYPQRLRRLYKDGVFDAVRLPRSVLKVKREMGKYAYLGQFLQEPVSPGGGMFETDKIRIGLIDWRTPGWRLCRYWDKASTFEGGDYTVGVLMGRAPDGVFWVLDVVRGQWEPNARERIIKQTAMLDGEKVAIRIEEEPSGSGKESALATVRNLAGFKVTRDKVSGDKVYRADPFAAQVNGENVRIQKADWNADYLSELRGFAPLAPHDDQVDASSGAFNYLAAKKIRIGAF